MNNKQPSIHGLSGYMSDRFQESMTAIQEYVHTTSVNAGWWDDPLPLGTLISLMHSELSEALEASRTGINTKDNHLPERAAVEVEFADLVIRVMSAAEYYGWDLAGAIVEKAEYNRTRPRKHGGKLF